MQLTAYPAVLQYILNNYFRALIVPFQHEDHPCPVFNTYDVWPESVSLVALQKTSSDVSNIFHFCFYQPERWNGKFSFKSHPKKLFKKVDLMCICCFVMRITFLPRLINMEITSLCYNTPFQALPL